MAKKKRRWLRVLAMLALIVVVAVVAVIFVVTRSSFICGVVLPRVSEGIGTPVVAKRVRLSLFSEVEIRDLVVGPVDAPLLRAERVECAYQPFRILSRELRVTQVRVDNATILVNGEPAAEQVVASERVSETAAEAMSRDGSETPKPSGETTAEPISITIPKLDLPVSVHVTDVMVRGLDVTYAAPDMKIGLKGIELHIPRIQNGERVEVDLSAGIDGVVGPDLTIPAGRCIGSAGIDLDSGLNPLKLELAGRVDQLSGKAGGVPLGDRVLALKMTAACEGETWTIDNVSLAESSKGTPEAVFAATGHVALAPLSCKLDITVEPVSSEALNLVGGLAGGYTFGKASATYKGTVTMDHDMTVRSTGEFLCRTLTVGIPGVELPDVPPVDVRAVHEVTVSLQDEELVASQVDVNVQQQGRETVKFRLTEPLTIRWAAESIEEGVGVSKAAILVDGFPLSLANLFLGRDAGITIRDGTLDSALAVSIGKLGRQVAVTGPVTVKNLNVLIDKDEIALSAVENHLSVTLADFNALDVASFTTRALVGGTVGLQSKLAAKVDLKTMAGTAELAVTEVNQQLLQAIPKAWLGGAAFPVLAAKAGLTSTFQDNFNVVTATGTIDIPRVKARYPGFEPFPTLGTSVGFDVALRGKTCEISRLDVASSQGGTRILHLGTSGTIPLPIASGEAALNVSSEGIDLKALADMVKPTASNTQAGASPAGPGKRQFAALIGARTGVVFAPTSPAVPKVEHAAELTKELGPIDLGGLSLNAKIGLRNLTYDALSIGSCDGSVRVADNKVNIPGMDLNVNGGSVNVSGDVDLGVKGFKYALRTKVAKLPFKPFVATFAPRFSGAVVGSLDSFELGASGAGTTLAAITRNLIADTRLDLGPVGIARIPAVTSWADRINVPELRHMQFDAGMLEGGIAAGKALIKSFTISGHDQAATITGSVGLDKVLDLSVEAGVAGKVAERLGSLGILRSFTTSRGDHAFLPVPIRVTGTITDPKFDVSGLSKDVVMKLGLDKTNELIDEKLGGETAKAVKGVLDVIPLPGRKNTGAPAKPKDIVGGLFGVGTALLRDKEEEKARERAPAVTEPASPSPPASAQTPPPQPPPPTPVPPVTQLPAPPAPATPAAPVATTPPKEPTEKPLTDEERHRQNIDRRQQRRKELENLGGSLLRGLLKGK